eukprot:3419732-Pyramimonas_sp.AAC.1
MARSALQVWLGKARSRACRMRLPTISVLICFGDLSGPTRSSTHPLPAMAGARMRGQLRSRLRRLPNAF